MKSCSNAACALHGGLSGLLKFHTTPVVPVSTNRRSQTLVTVARLVA